MDANARWNQVGPGYFHTMGIPLIAGREFTESDAGDATRVTIVNESFARKFGYEPREIVGKFMGQGTGDAVELDLQIVGVTRDASYNNVRDEIPPQFFRPHRQNATLGFLTFYARTDGSPTSVIRAVPDLVKRLDSSLPVEELKTVDQQVGETLVLDRLISILAASFAVLATLLAAMGLYGVLSYSVAQRTREIGLRIALGADTRSVRAMILRQVGGMLLVGLQGHDPLVFTSAIILLAAVAAAAGYIPAFRASRVDPMQALRYE